MKKTPFSQYFVFLLLVWTPLCVLASSRKQLQASLVVGSPNRLGNDPLEEEDIEEFKRLGFNSFAPDALENPEYRKDLARFLQSIRSINFKLVRDFAYFQHFQQNRPARIAVLKFISGRIEFHWNFRRNLVETFSIITNEVLKDLLTVSGVPESKFLRIFKKCFAEWMPNIEPIVDSENNSTNEKIAVFVAEINEFRKNILAHMQTKSVFKKLRTTNERIESALCAHKITEQEVSSIHALNSVLGIIDAYNKSDDATINSVEKIYKRYGGNSFNHVQKISVKLEIAVALHYLKKMIESSTEVDKGEMKRFLSKYENLRKGEEDSVLYHYLFKIEKQNSEINRRNLRKLMDLATCLGLSEKAWMPIVKLIKYNCHINNLSPEQLLGSDLVIMVDLKDRNAVEFIRYMLGLSLGNNLSNSSEPALKPQEEKNSSHYHDGIAKEPHDSINASNKLEPDDVQSPNELPNTLPSAPPLDIFIQEIIAADWENNRAAFNRYIGELEGLNFDNLTDIRGQRSSDAQKSTTLESAHQPGGSTAQSEKSCDNSPGKNRDAFADFNLAQNMAWLKKPYKSKEIKQKEHKVENTPPNIKPADPSSSNSEYEIVSVDSVVQASKSDNESENELHEEQSGHYAQNLLYPSLQAKIEKEKEDKLTGRNLWPTFFTPESTPNIHAAGSVDENEKINNNSGFANFKNENEVDMHKDHGPDSYKIGSSDSSCIVVDEIPENGSPLNKEQEQNAF